MKKLLLIASLCLLILDVIGQVVPEDRRVDWESAIQNISYFQPNVQLNVMDFGATGNGISNDQPAVMSAISSLNGHPGYIYFPPGDYLIEQPIVMADSCVLKGAGSEFSTLIFDMGETSANCISISKGQTSDFVEITGGYNKGNNLITISDISQFSVGDYIEIRQENGAWDVVPISWADYSVGQITRVIAIVGNDLLLESELRIDYSEDLNPEVRPIVPISNAGIQCMRIKRIDQPMEGAGANIYTNMAANCIIRGVESDSSVGAHISINTSLNIFVDGCYFRDAFTYDGASMRGYGVALSHHSSECLITNNIFKHLRHAMMIKTGANGNVFSYNYSIEPFRTEPIPDASGDISFHGHYAFSNLFEGNIAQNIVIDHYWGPSGPYNTIFRNRAELYGIIMTTSDLLETNSQNFVGSEVTNFTFLHGMYILTGEDQFQYGNNIKGDIIPPGTNVLSDSSYYLSEQPYFWNQFIDWPSVGIPNMLDVGTIPAKMRYEIGGVVTLCPDSIITTVPQDLSKNNLDIEFWPNPSNNFINVRTLDNYSGQLSLSLFNAVGEVVLSKSFEAGSSQVMRISTQDIKSGMYLMSVRTVDQLIWKKVIIAK